MHSPAIVGVHVVCRRCDRLLAIAELDGNRVAYRVPERPSATTAWLCNVPPDVPASLRVVRSVADIPAAFAALRKPWHQTLAFPAHYSCPATPQVRQDRLDARVLAAVAAGEASVTLG